ncbi:hypothetical protein [Brevibacterium siliguriense]|uniref:hypothetical protein n=1 Tax=Brevibacterium siliguriense TaxID=1136497 RepID=UPI000B853046|nr:hypothetical protein [Brevibacterium siliguriense]
MRAQDALDSVLERLAILPVVSAVVTESTDAALSISERLGRPLLERSRTLLLAPNRSGENVIVSVRGSELLDAGPTADLVLPEPKTSQPWPLRSGWKPSSAHRQ